MSDLTLEDKIAKAKELLHVEHVTTTENYVQFTLHRTFCYALLTVQDLKDIGLPVVFASGCSIVCLITH